MPGYTLQPDLTKEQTKKTQHETFMLCGHIKMTMRIFYAASSHLIFACVFYDLCAQIAGLDGAKILLVALPVAGILVEHVGCAGFSLRLNDGIPQLLSLHHTFSPALLLVPDDKQEQFNRFAPSCCLLVNSRLKCVLSLLGIELLKLFSPALI